MTSPLIIFRPEPGASQTAERAAEAGFACTSIPLFEIEPLDWEPPDAAAFDAVLLTSANSIRHGGEALALFHGLPVYAVGAQTAQAARDHGFTRVESGASGVAEMADRLRADGLTRIFHPAGETTRPFNESGLTIKRVPIYAAEHVTPPDLKASLSDNAILLVHSPRAAVYLDALCKEQGVDRSRYSLVAISDAALSVAGTGWRDAIAADRPGDAAMLAAASSLGGANAIG